MLTISHLSFSYPDFTHVLSDIHCHIDRGERVGIIGPNGAGKTTLFLLICGILPATQGVIRCANTPIVAGEFRPEIGLVFQNPDDQLFCASVWDDVSFGPKNLGLTPTEVTLRTQQSLEIAGVAHLSQRPSHHLSSGQKRMVAIAAVLACQPQLMIYDEPTANLDSRARRRFIRFLEEHHQTFLLASHDLELILEVSDRVLLIHDGKIMADGIPSQIMGNGELMESYGLERPHSLEHHAGITHGHRFSAEENRG